MSQHLTISMNDVTIGCLSKHSSGALSFQYEDSWLNNENARPISLSLPLLQGKFTGEKVYNFFDNLLPDNPQIRSRIQTKFQTLTNQPFDLLANIGRDCVGAIQMSEDTIPFKKAIHADPLSDKEIASILKNFRTAPLGMQDREEDFRISIAGAQEKSAFLQYQGKWCRPLGTTPTTHIFKLPIGLIEHQQMDLTESCENEWLCTQIAAAFGFEVASADICHFEDVKALVVKRFDRQWSTDNSWLMRLPQEDMCQALGYSPSLKYESDGGPGIKNIMTLLLDSKTANMDRDTFFRTQILFFLLAAIDGHAKNFSLFLEPSASYRLTPLYDIMSAHPLLHSKQLQKQKIKMAMALIGKNKHYHWSQIQRRHFISTANAVNFSTHKAEAHLHAMLSQVEAVIQTVSKQLPADFPTHISESIFSGMLDAKDLIE